MNGTDVNVVLAVVLVLTVAMALAVWLSPKAMDYVVLRCYVRAKALRASRHAYAETERIALQEGIS